MINEIQPKLVARAWLKDDAMAHYSEEGTPLQNRVLTLDQLRMQLSCGGAFRENIDAFVAALQSSGFAEIRQPKVMTQFGVL